MSTPIQKNTEANEPFVIEGVITELQVSLGKENLLKQIDRHYKRKSVLTGLGAVVGDLYGQAAAAASVALYEDEDTENFLCLIDEQVMCGTFGGASKLPVGKKVKAVVHKQGDVLVAEGILSESEGLVWVHYPLGCKAERIATFKLAWWCFLFQLIGMSLLAWGTLGFGSEKFWWSMKMSILWGGALCFGMALWDSLPMDAPADPATEIFRMLGFAEPEAVNLNSYQYGIVHSHALLHSVEIRANYGNIHCYKKAIEDGKIKMASQ